jgi:hypothetical protein
VRDVICLLIQYNSSPFHKKLYNNVLIHCIHHDRSLISYTILYYKYIHSDEREIERGTARGVVKSLREIY